jgi:hypothetical protein
MRSRLVGGGEKVPLFFLEYKKQNDNPSVVHHIKTDPMSVTRLAIPVSENIQNGDALSALF